MDVPEENIDIEWSDVDQDSLVKQGFAVSDSFAVKDLQTCRVTLRAKELAIEGTLKDQFAAFADAMNDYGYEMPEQQKDWMQAFIMLKNALKPKK